MIILRQNFINTTTQMTTTNGTITVKNLFDRNKNTTWESENAGTDSTSATMTISFDTTQTVSRICMQNHNLKQFTVQYEEGAGTVTAFVSNPISITANSTSHHYFSFNTVTTIEKIHLSMDSTFPSAAEKFVGEFMITNDLYDFSTDRLPSAAQYKPRIFKKQVVHEMSDGGISLYNIRNKFQAEIRYNFVPTSSVDTLKTVYDLSDPFIFIPFETATSWDGNLAECVWIGPFEFIEFSSNNLGNGFNGRLQLRQTPGGSF